MTRDHFIVGKTAIYDVLRQEDCSYIKNMLLRSVMIEKCLQVFAVFILQTILNEIDTKNKC